MCRDCGFELSETIDVLSFLRSFEELAGRQGVFAAVFGNLDKDNELRCKPFGRSDLAFSDLDLGFRPFASVFRFF